MMLTYGQFLRPAVASGAAKLVNELSEIDNTQVVFVFPRNRHGIIPVNNNKILVENFIDYRLRDFRNIFSLIRIRKIIKKHNPDIIHIQCGHLWLSLLLPFIKEKMVVTVHDATPHSGEEKLHTLFLTRCSFKYAEGVIVHGNQQKELIKKKFGLDESKIFVNSFGSILIDNSKRPNLVFYSDIDDENENQLVLTESTKSPDKEKIILFHGRINKYKGLKYLIEAEPEITKHIPNAKIMIAGRGNDLNKYRSKILANKNFILKDNFIENDDLINYFAASSLVVLPYIDATQSGIIPMAYKFKKPVVVTDVGSFRDTVENNKTGYIVPPRDSQSLASAIVELLNNDQKRINMGIAGHKKLIRELSWKSIAKRTNNVYRQTLGLRND